MYTYGGTYRLIPVAFAPTYIQTSLRLRAARARVAEPAPRTDPIMPSDATGGVSARVRAVPMAREAAEMESPQPTPFREPALSTRPDAPASFRAGFSPPAIRLEVRAEE